MQCIIKTNSSQTNECKTSRDKNLSLQGKKNISLPSRDDSEPSSPILSLNEVSSSRQDPPDNSRSPSPSGRSGSSFPQPFVYEKDLALSGSHDPRLGTVERADQPWPEQPLDVPPPLVPLLFPYPSMPHSVVYMSQYMNPFLHPCQTASITEKKKRNRTFIDPVSEVSRNLINSKCLYI